MRAVTRGQQVWIAVGALAVLLAAGIAFAAYQSFLIGEISIAEDTRHSALRVQGDSAPRIAILRSEATAQFLRSGASYEAHPQYWQKLLGSAGQSTEMISDAQLEEDLIRYRVLVLPSAVCLNQKQRAAIRGFLRRGNGVVATWITGTRDQRGEWKGWDFLQELTGADAVEVSERPAPWFVSFTAGSALTAGLPAASRAQVVSPERASATALRVDGYWSDYRLFPAEEKLPANFQGSLLHREWPQGGRVAWLGFQENSAVAEGPDRAIIDALLLNVIAWTAGETLVEVANWPAPYSSAVLPAMNVELTSENANYAAESLLKTESRGTFYCVAREVRDNANLLQNLRRAGEVAARGWSGGQLEPTNRFRMAYELFASRRTLRAKTGQEVSGFLPPFEKLPGRALPALAAAGYRYYLTGAAGNSVLPQIMLVSQKWGPLCRQRQLVRLVRVGDDDLSLSPLGLTGLDQDWIVQRLSADADIVSSLGGLYVLSFHTQGLSTPEYVPVLTRLIKSWQGNSVWLARGDELSRWWLQRSHLTVAASNRSGAIQLKVEYGGGEPMAGATVNIYPGGDAGKLTLSPVQQGIPQPSLRLDPEHGRLQVRFPRLAQGRFFYELRRQP